MQPYLGFGAFKCLKDKHDFQQIRVSFDTMEWQAGVKLDPEVVCQQTDKTA